MSPDSIPRARLECKACSLGAGVKLHYCEARGVQTETICWSSSMIPPLAAIWPPAGLSAYDAGNYQGSGRIWKAEYAGSEKLRSSGSQGLRRW
mmetsp:Transcript_44466/g.69542  ORF Transcript_44466/g.69542 Transcript_44466/m.69542 type:complete len:93 (+) Transcript_44466:24-302(+)